jgi:hypothetical protein
MHEEFLNLMQAGLLGVTSRDGEHTVSINFDDRDEANALFELLQKMMDTPFVEAQP